MPNCLFVTDLHGSTERYGKLFELIIRERPEAVFIGGDLLPHAMHRTIKSGGAEHDFVADYLVGSFSRLKDELGSDYPRVFLILGNDDPRSEEPLFEQTAEAGVWEYIHQRWVDFDQYRVYGYAYVPPTPFQLKDWDRYDVSRFVDPGCIAPEDGWRSVAVSDREAKLSTIKKDLAKLEQENGFDKTIFLFHTPPYQTNLDRAALDGKMVDHAPVDVYVGSIAVKEFIERSQPLITLHGHVHESTRLTGEWRDRLGKTYLFSAAHDGPELALVRFDPDNPQRANRELL